MTTFSTTGTFNSGILIGDPNDNGTPAQPTTVGEGINKRQVSAALEIQSTTGGFMPPRMTTAQIDAMAANTDSPMGPVQLVFNTDTQSMVTIINGSVTNSVGSVKRWTMTWTGATAGANNFADAFSLAPNFEVISTTINQPYLPFVIGGDLTIQGTGFTAVGTPTITVAISNTPPLNLLSFEPIRNVLTKVDGKNSATFQLQGHQGGGAVNPLDEESVLALFLNGDPADFTGGENSPTSPNLTTVTINVFYI